MSLGISFGWLGLVPRTTVQDPQWRSWVHHAPNTAAQFLTDGDWPRCTESMFLPASLVDDRFPSALRCHGCVCETERQHFRPLLGFPPYERAPVESPICAALMRRSLLGDNNDN